MPRLAKRRVGRRSGKATAAGAISTGGTRVPPDRPGVSVLRTSELVLGFEIPRPDGQGYFVTALRAYRMAFLGLLVGIGIYANREFILRTQTFARLVLGLAASSTVPLLTLIFLLTTGHRPLVGLGTLWQLIIMSVGGAIATPVCFEIFGWLHRLLGPPPVSELSFRPDREIRRGR